MWDTFLCNRGFWPDAAISWWRGAEATGKILVYFLYSVMAELRYGDRS